MAFSNLFVGPLGRNRIEVTVDNPTINPATTIEVYTGPTLAGPWTLTPNLETFNCVSVPNPTGPAFPSSGWAISGLDASDVVFVRLVIPPGQPDPEEEVIGGTGTAPYDAWNCLPAFNITQNTATAVFGATVGSANIDLAPCPHDTYTVRWGTTPGGPYPNAVSEDATAFSPSLALTGLPAGTTIYYHLEVSETTQTQGVYFTGPECSFQTLAPGVPAPNGFSWCGAFYPAGTPSIFVGATQFGGGYWRPVSSIQEDGWQQ